MTQTNGGEGGARAPTSEGGAGGDASGQGGADALAGSPPMGEAGAPACEFPRGECDGTLQTVCESDLTWNAGRCGSCTHACDGACEQAKCNLKEPTVGAGQAIAMLTEGDTHYYVLNADYQLLSVERVWGKLKIVAPKLEGEPDSLAQSGKHIYAWDKDLWSTPQRVALDEDAVVSETFESTSFGASKAGIYYVSDGELWFRPTESAAATMIDARGPEILCSSSELVLLREDGILYRASGSELISIGAAPRPVERAVCFGDAALLLGAFNVTRVTPEGVGETVPIPEGRQVLEAGLIAFDGESFSLAFESKGQVNVRTFAVGTAAHASIVGLPADALLVHHDGNFIWYNAPEPPSLFQQLQRASIGRREL